MTALTKFLFATLVSFLFCTNVHAQAKFTATINPQVINADETAEISFTVESAAQVDQLQAPDLKDFIIVSGPNQQSNMQIINGNMKQSVSLSYVIKPKSSGTFQIDEATVNVNGKELRSNKLTLRVTKGSASPEKKIDKKKDKPEKKKPTPINQEENYTLADRPGDIKVV